MDTEGVGVVLSECDMSVPGVNGVGDVVIVLPFSVHWIQILWRITKASFWICGSGMDAKWMMLWNMVVNVSNNTSSRSELNKAIRNVK